MSFFFYIDLGKLVLRSMNYWYNMSEMLFSQKGILSRLYQRGIHQDNIWQSGDIKVFWKQCIHYSLAVLHTIKFNLITFNKQWTNRVISWRLKLWKYQNKLWNFIGIYLFIDFNKAFESVYQKAFSVISILDHQLNIGSLLIIVK